MWHNLGHVQDNVCEYIAGRPIYGCYMPSNIIPDDTWQVSLCIYARSSVCPIHALYLASRGWWDRNPKPDIGVGPAGG